MCDCGRVTHWHSLPCQWCVVGRSATAISAVVIGGWAIGAMGARSSWLVLLVLSLLLLGTPVAQGKKKGDVTELFAALGSQDAGEARNAAQTLSQRSPLLGVHAEEAHRRMQVLIDSVAGKDDGAGDVDTAVNELAAYIQKLVRAA